MCSLELPPIRQNFPTSNDVYGEREENEEPNWRIKKAHTEANIFIGKPAPYL
jgi:hypothetical protein